MSTTPDGPDLYRWGYRAHTREWVYGRWAYRGGDVTVDNARSAFDVDILAQVPPPLRRRLAEVAPGKPLPARAFDGEPGAWRTMTCPDCWRV